VERWQRREHGRQYVQPRLRRFLADLPCTPAGVRGRSLRCGHRGARSPDHKIVPQCCHGRVAVQPLCLRRPALLFLSRPSSVRCGLWSWDRAPRWDRPWHRAADDARVRGGGVGARAVFRFASAFNGDLSAWNVGNVLKMDFSACGPASAVPCRPCVCTPAGGSHSPPAAPERCLGGEVGASSLSRRALSHRGARTPDHKIVPQRCHGRVAVRPLTARVGRWVRARSVLRRHGLQRRPVGVECQQRHDHGRQCVRPRLHTAPRCPRVRSPTGGSHAPPAALGRCLGGGRGESIPCPRQLCVVVVGSSPTGATAPCGGG
jgi:hypothetical protein